MSFDTELIQPSTRLRDAETGRERVDSGEPLLRDARSWVRVRPALDFILLGASAASVALFSSGETVAGWVLWSAVFSAIVLYLSHLRGTYVRRAKLDTLDDLRATASVVGAATSIVVTLRVLLDSSSETPALHSIRLGVAAALSLACGRVALNLVQVAARRRGKALVPTLIIGAGHIGRMTAKRLLMHPELGFRPVGFLDKEPREEAEDPPGLPVLGASWDFDRIAADNDIGQVIVTFSTAPSEVLLRIVNRCEERGIAVALVPRLFEKVAGRLTIEHLGGLPLLTSHPNNPKGWQFAAKYAIDRVAALFFLCLLGPVLLVCAIAVWISLGRPILFRQRRVGCDGRVFEMLKFRSLRPVVEPAGLVDLPEDTAPGGVEGQNRVTRSGAFLRNTSLDELPQLFNVLKGEMSIVGPRPERPEFVEIFQPRVHRYDDRHRVKAGITGWAQVNGLRGRTSLSDRIEWDNYYIENASLWLDLKIIARTIVTLPQHSKTCR